MDSLTELLEKIRIRPGMFLGKPSIELLRAFISGYLVNKKEPDIDTDFYLEFQTFIEQKYSRKGTTHCITIIQSITTSDEEAFYKFFELLDEFLGIQK